MYNLEGNSWLRRDQPRHHIRLSERRSWRRIPRRFRSRATRVALVVIPCGIRRAPRGHGRDFMEPRVTHTLADARAAFVAAIKQDTPGTELPRLVAVLDALIAWSTARPELLSFRPPTGRSAGVSFERVGSKAPFWSAQVTRGVGPKLEIHGKVGEALSDAERASVIETLNAHSREVLVEGDRLRIGFGALKNAAAQAAVVALMERLVARGAAPPKARTD